MTERVERVRTYANNILGGIEDAGARRFACTHSYGVTQYCALLAAARGLNVELAIIIGLTHDVYRFRTGVAPQHSQNGTEMIRVAFKYDLEGLFSEGEQTIIKSAIYHHSEKRYVHDEYDELIKDCDVLEHLPFVRTYGRVEARRLQAVMNELSLPAPDIELFPDMPPRTPVYDKSRMADIAEALAGRGIVGDRQDADYMSIIRYFPEDSAFDELKNAWCAAFVYHCCAEAGLHLPIRTPGTAVNLANCRLACVAAWHEWGKDNGFCHPEGGGFTPERGDIVIYNNIIPDGDKVAGGAWCDHIGVVLGGDTGRLTVAEGNVGNKNVSGIVSRARDETIGCYIRVPPDYVQDGWKYDYKTGKLRVVNYGEG